MDILYQDNHLICINKPNGQLTQPDTTGSLALEQEVGSYLKRVGNKPGMAYVGVIHRLDRPVSGVVLFAKNSKSLVRMNEQLKSRGFKKIYWAITESCPDTKRGELVHHLSRDTKNKRSIAHSKPNADSKEAVLRYTHLSSYDNYHLLEIELLTGRHHQIRCQLSAIGCPIKGDLKYGAKRSNKSGGVYLHSRSLSFSHPKTNEIVTIIAPAPSEDALWLYFMNEVINK